jgi:protein-disulfide isomerase
MASRAKAKEEARQRRLAEEAERAAQAQRTRRLQILAGVVITAIVVVAVAIAISAGGGSGSSGLQKGQKLRRTVAAMSALLDGIPQSGTTLGSPSAPVTLTYLGDLECPICRAFTVDGGFPQLVQNEVRQGKVKVVYRSYCTATCNGPGPDTFDTQQAAAYAAGSQKKFWDYTELFYQEQGAEGSSYVTEAYLDGLARQVPGLNFAAWKAQRQNSSLISQVKSEDQSASTQGFSGTPTLIFAGPKGKAQVPTAEPSYSDLQKALKQVA